jgi:hypothetical protein
MIKGQKLRRNLPATISDCHAKLTRPVWLLLRAVLG